MTKKAAERRFGWISGISNQYLLSEKTWLWSLNAAEVNRMCETCYEQVAAERDFCKRRE